MTASSSARRLLTAAVTASLAAALAACGSSAGQGAAPTRTVTVTAPPPSAPATPASQGTSPAPAGPGPCATSALSVRTGVAGAAAGSIFVAIEFTNKSGSACTLFGYPGVSFLTSQTGGHQIGAAAARNPQHQPRLVTLQAGETGSATLQIAAAANFPAARCHQVNAPWLRVYPPNQRASVVVPFTSQACAKPVPLLSVGVVLPGHGVRS